MDSYRYGYLDDDFIHYCSFKITMKPITNSWEERFDQRFPNKLGEVIDDFGSTVKDELREFVAQERISAQEEEMKIITDAFDWMLSQDTSNKEIIYMMKEYVERLKGNGDIIGPSNLTKEK